IGPYLVTKETIANPQNLRLWLRLNGEIMQDGHTSNMIFDVAYLVHYISQFTTLHPGDLIATGTPAGVGVGRSPARFLTTGDIMELGVDELGEQKQAIT